MISTTTSFFTSEDKAIGNVAFICQQLYPLVHNKIGTNKFKYIKLNIPVHKIKNQVISNHTTYLRNKIKLVVDEEIKKLPNIY